MDLPTITFDVNYMDPEQVPVTAGPISPPSETVDPAYLYMDAEYIPTLADYYGKNPSHYWYDESQMMNMFYPGSRRTNVYKIVESTAGPLAQPQLTYLYWYAMSEGDLPKFAIPIPLESTTTTTLNPSIVVDGSYMIATTPQEQLYAKSLSQTLGMGQLSEDQIALYARMIQQQKEVKRLQEELVVRQQQEAQIKQQLEFYYSFSTNICQINQNICREYYKRQHRFNQTKRLEASPTLFSNPRFHRVKGQPSPPGQGRDYLRKQRKREMLQREQQQQQESSESS
jgi:hypothetical protein